MLSIIIQESMIQRALRCDHTIVSTILCNFCISSFTTNSLFSCHVSSAIKCCLLPYFVILSRSSSGLRDCEKLVQLCLIILCSVFVYYQCTSDSSRWLAKILTPCCPTEAKPKINLYCL